jgi:hypothetical protein
MKSITLTLCFFFFLQLILFGQYKEGYIITNKDDTIKGYINFEGSVINCSHCSFKKDIDSSPTNYAPGDIKAFRFNESKYFVTKNILIDNSPKTVFMEWLIKGKASILCYNPPSLNPRYYIILNNDSLFELKNSKIIREIKGSQYKIDKKEYIGELAVYFKDCPQLYDEITNLSYTGNSLIKISKEYHQITCGNNDCIIYEDKSRKPVFSVGLTGAYIVSKLRLTIDPVQYAKTTSDPGVGIYLNISNLPLLSPKFSFHSQLIYHSATYIDESYKGYSNDYKDKTFCTVHSIKIPMMMKYNFFYTGLSPFITVGVIVNRRYSYEFYNQLLINRITQHYDYQFGLAALQFGLISGIGMEYITPSNLGFQMEADYEISPNFIGTYPSDMTQNMNFLVQCSLFYKFNRRR